MSPGKRRVAAVLIVLGTTGTLACRPRPPVLETAALLSSRGREAEATVLLREHLREHPDDAAARRLLVRVLGALGDIGAAEAEIRELEARLPRSSPIPWIERGHVLELGHRYDHALAMYDKAAAVAPRDPEGPRVGGLRAARWGEPEAALPRLSEALRRDAGDAGVWHALGLVRAHMGDLAGARAAYESGLAVDADALENRVGLATVALLEGKPEIALAEYDRLLARRPRFAAGYLGRSWALIELGRLEDAELALARGERLGAERAAVVRQRALIGRRRGKKEHVENP